MGEDIVKLLRSFQTWDFDAGYLMCQAADEIERLRNEVRGIPEGGFEHEDPSSL